MGPSEQQQQQQHQQGMGVSHPFQPSSNPSQDSQWGGSESACLLPSNTASTAGTGCISTTTIPTGGPGHANATATSTHPEIPNTTNYSSTAIWATTRCSTNAAIPSNIIGISDISTTIPTTRNGHTIWTAPPPTLNSWIWKDTPYHNYTCI